MTGLAASWQSAKVVRTREKVSFFFGVMNLVVSALMFGMAPQYVVFSFHMRIVNLRDADGYISGTQSRDVISSLYVSINTRNVHGITFSLTCAIMSLSSISYSYGSFQGILPSLSLATVSRMDLLRVRSLRGGIVWCFTTRTRLRRSTSTCMRRCRLRLSGMLNIVFMFLGQLFLNVIHTGISIPMPQNGSLHSMPSRTCSQSGLYC
jgi:hypothetical protein